MLRLYCYANRISKLDADLGKDVDDGSTVTDFLPAERARGITIQSAAITFQWPPGSAASGQHQAQRSSAPTDEAEDPTRQLRSSTPHNINLIDTPGHADFTFEVLRSVRVLDGAVCVLDGVAGVEAQTEKVWTQADHYQIPKIVYINKLDRDGATFARTVKEVGIRLHSWPAVCQIPWWRQSDAKLVGLGDVVGLRALLWEEGSDGKAVKVFNIDELSSIDQKFALEIKKARIALVELLSEHDEGMVEQFLDVDSDHLAILGSAITESLRRCVLQYPQTVVPIFAGASFRNIGVQPLLDAIVDLLPSPMERPDPEINLAGTACGLNEFLTGKVVAPTSLNDPVGKSKKSLTARVEKGGTAILQSIQACALAFKVVSDPRRGVLVYVRVYAGSLPRNAPLFNTNLKLTEKAPRLLKMYASDSVEVESIPAGQIGVIVGLKHARTGDTLIAYTGVNPKTGPPTPVNSLELRPIVVPPPVFFTSVEPNSLSEEKHIADTLALLLREDPSLHVSVDTESGQTHLSGMGELHLEIARDRLINDFKAKASIGKIQIGYREAVLGQSARCTEHLDREVAGKQARATCTAIVFPNEETPSVPVEPDNGNFHSITLSDSNRLSVRHPTLTPSGDPITPDHPPLPPQLPLSTVVTAFQTGVSAALASGPQHTFAVHSTHVEIDFDPATHVFSDTTPAALSSVARLAVKAALKSAAQEGGIVLMEPVMLATISVNESDLGSVVHDITSARGGQIVSLDGGEESAAEAGVTSTHSSVQSQDELLVVDPRRIYAPPDPFEASQTDSGYAASVDRQRQIIARVPLKEMVGYLKHLRSLTGGRGTFVMTVDSFERMGSQRQKQVLNEMRGDYVSPVRV